MTKQFTIEGFDGRPRGISAAEHDEHLRRNENYPAYESEQNQRRLANSRATGRYTLKDAATMICEPNNEDASALLSNLVRDAQNNSLPRYWPDKFKRTNSKIVRDWYDEVYWYDLNEWLKANEPEIFKGFQFPEPDDAAPASTTGAAKDDRKPIKENRVNKLRRDILEPAIDKAIAQAGSDDTAAVWLELRELARNKTKPFTGVIIGEGLYYTDVKDKPQLLSKNALSSRLTRRAAGKK